MLKYHFLGILSAWDTRQNKCFMHWEADDSEIGRLHIHTFGYHHKTTGGGNTVAVRTRKVSVITVGISAPDR